MCVVMSLTDPKSECWTQILETACFPKPFILHDEGSQAGPS